VFKARVAPLVAKAQVRYERRSRPVHIRTSFWHRAKSWPHHRRILVKIDVTAAGLNVRFMVTNRRGRATDLVAWYDARGTSENWIKELKLDIHADRLSCHRFRANAFRLQLHSLALVLLAYFRRAVLAGTRLAAATIGTIRLHLLKVAGASCAACDGSGFISHLTGPANRSSQTAIARWRARRHNGVRRDIFLVGPLERVGGVFAHAPSRSFRGTEASLNPSDARRTVSSLPIVAVSEGDRSASDSFVNNAG
jgi:Transposase DDE domain group 1